MTHPNPNTVATRETSGCCHGETRGLVWRVTESDLCSQVGLRAWLLQGWLKVGEAQEEGWYRGWLRGDEGVGPGGRAGTVG